MIPPKGLQFTLSLTADEADLAVVDFTHEEALSSPFHLRVRVARRVADLSPEVVRDRPASHRSLPL